MLMPDQIGPGAKALYVGDWTAVVLFFADFCVIWAQNESNDYNSSNFWIVHLSPRDHVLIAVEIYIPSAHG